LIRKGSLETAELRLLGEDSNHSPTMTSSRKSMKNSSQDEDQSQARRCLMVSSKRLATSPTVPHRRLHKEVLMASLFSRNRHPMIRVKMRGSSLAWQA